MQLKKLKKRLSKDKYIHRQYMIGMRSQGQNKIQEKDRWIDNWKSLTISELMDR